MNKDLKRKKAFTLAEGATHVGIFHNIGGTLHKLVESFTHVGIFHNTRRVGFTLAEVLITLGIIGVVSAMTIPTLVSNFKQRSYDTASNTFTRKLGEALKLMNSDSNLAGHKTTAEFVNALSKNIKIVKICPSEKLKECFASQFSTNTDTFKTEELKQAKNLNQNGEYGTETVGVVFADGVSALIAYNKNAKQDPFNNRIVNITSNGNGLKNRTIGLSTDALAILYDVSGSNDSNTYGTNDEGKFKDIRGINVSIKVGADIVVLNSYAPVDCSNPANEGYQYCDSLAIKNKMNSNYYAGAQLACSNIGMTLANNNTLETLYNKRGEEGIPTNGYYWTSTSGAPPGHADLLDFGWSPLMWTEDTIDMSNIGAICVTH